MMDDAMMARESDEQKLLLGAVVFMLFLTMYTAYSVEKFITLKARSIVKSNIAMKVIQHNVYSVCPKCGSRGMPICPACSVPMYWNGYSGTFICTACGKGGFPQCPRCHEYTTWIESI